MGTGDDPAVGAARVPRAAAANASLVGARRTIQHWWESPPGPGRLIAAPTTATEVWQEKRSYTTTVPFTRGRCAARTRDARPYGEDG